MPSKMCFLVPSLVELPMFPVVHSGMQQVGDDRLAGWPADRPGCNGFQAAP